MTEQELKDLMWKIADHLDAGLDDLAKALHKASEFARIAKDIKDLIESSKEAQAEELEQLIKDIKTLLGDK